MEKDNKTSSDLAEEYYDSDGAFKYYTIVHSSIDYTGIAAYPEEKLEKDAVTGESYPRGTGMKDDSIMEANILRD